MINLIEIIMKKRKNNYKKTKIEIISLTKIINYFIINFSNLFLV